jgi:hypothetical protein
VRKLPQHPILAQRMSIMKQFSAVSLLLALSASSGCVQLYPLEQLAEIPQVEQVAGETVHIKIPLATGQYIRRVKTNSDQIIVTLERCGKCKEPGRIAIPNPNNLPIYFSDEKVTKQVYPVNEFASDVEPSQQ